MMPGFDLRGSDPAAPAVVAPDLTTDHGNAAGKSDPPAKPLPPTWLRASLWLHLRDVISKPGAGSRSRSSVLTNLSAFLVSALLAVGISVAAVDGVGGWLGAGLALIMLAIAAVDGRRFLIPDSMNAAALALGLVHAVAAGQGDASVALAGAALRAGCLGLSFLALRLIYARLRGRQGIGLGDVKLAAVAGVWLGWLIMPIAVEIAAVSALSTHALRRYVLRRSVRRTDRLPFGLYFAPAIWIGWLLQATILQDW
jgi:leader peptidase (prepilin peptidase)/N-methyltransferase